MLKIKFRYRDEYNYPNWSEQECIVRSVKECKEIYGLDECEYEIISLKNVLSPIREAWRSLFNTKARVSGKGGIRLHSVGRDFRSRAILAL
jgi:hypothetical protein